MGQDNVYCYGQNKRIFEYSGWYPNDTRMVLGRYKGFWMLYRPEWYQKNNNLNTCTLVVSKSCKIFMTHIPE